MTLLEVGKHNLTVIRKAIEAVKTTGADGIEFDPSFYYYAWTSDNVADPSKQTEQCFRIKTFPRFEVHGNGAILCRTIDAAIASEVHDEFALFDIGKLVFKEITLTQRLRMSTQGTVTAVTSTYWDIRLDAGFPTYSEIDYLARYVPATGAIDARRTHSGARITVSSQGNSVYRVMLPPNDTFTPSTDGTVAVGDRMVLVEYKRGAKVFELGSVNTALFKDVRIPRAGNLIFAGNRVDNLQLDTILIGTNQQIMGVVAAGANIQYIRNVNIFNFQMTGFGDDFLNFHTRRWEMSFASGSTIRAKFRNIIEAAEIEPPPRIGDVVVLRPLNSWTGAIKAKVTNLTTYQSVGQDPSLTKVGEIIATVTLDTPLPSGFSTTTWIAYNESNAPVIKANLLRATRSTGRGLLWSSHDVDCNDFKAEGLRQAFISACDPIDANDDLTVTGFSGGHHYTNCEGKNCGWNTQYGQGQSAVRFFLGDTPAIPGNAPVVIAAEAPSNIVTGCTFQGKIDGSGWGGIAVGGLTVRTPDLVIANTGQRRAGATGNNQHLNDVWVTSGKLIGPVTNTNAVPKQYQGTGGVISAT